jgi:EAL domain-containing protein (putative c-di-GMP-specific phosphodiesterase class I)/DNA-binding response OmpR family regulator
MSGPGLPMEPFTGSVLVVDDEPAVRALFARALRDAGCDTLEAADGIEALELLERQPVALILLDSTMPRLDGAGVIRAVREREATRSLPVILVTAKADLEDRVEGLEAGADDYLAKPVALDELVAHVRAQLRSHASWRQALERETEERRRMTAALHRARGDGSLEFRARSLVEELTPALGLDRIAVVTFAPDGRVILLATAGSWTERDRLGPPGLALEPGLADTFRARAVDGPWVQRLAASDQAARRVNGREVACVPLPGRDGPLGLMLFGASVTDQGDGLARRMPVFLEAAAMTAMLLRPTLEADQDRLRARAGLEAVIAERAFLPNFQPLVSLDDAAIVGYEALTRFTDGTPPDVRFAEAERLGLGPELERATLRAAVLASASLPTGAFLALNVSPSLVLSGEGLIAVLGARARDLVLELTEHAPVDDYAALRAALERIDPPVKVAVDDAGSGYASMRHILALRPAYVKLDLTWVRGIETDPARQALVAGLVHFAAETGCQLIGEGVETEAERRTLRRLGVPLGQGYLFGRPLPAPTPDVRLGPLAGRAVRVTNEPLRR